MLFRASVIVAVTATAAVSLFAQVPSPHREDVIFFNHAVAGIAAGDVPEELINKVRETLTLSDAQVSALKILLTMQSQATMQIHQTALENQKKLDDLISQPNPNPTEVGNAFLASRSTHDQLQAAQDKFRSDFRALLNAQQRSTLDKLQAASEQIGGLTRVGILSGGSAETFFMTSPISYPAGAIGIQRHLSNER
jgi:Spy/CpxP family protein refolding chaperone